MKNQLIKQSWIYAMAIFTLVACTEENPVPPTPVKENKEGKFLVAVSVPGSTTATYFLPANSLENEKDSISPKGTGLEFTNTFTQFMSYGHTGLVGIKYGRGDAHIGQRFTINPSGAAMTVGNQFEIQNGFVTAGAVGDYAYTIMSGYRAADKTVGTMNRIGLSAGEPQFQTFKVNQFSGFEGKNAALIGLADGKDDAFYTSLHFHENTDIDNVVVAKINAKTLKTEAVYSDSRLSISGGFYRSARYSQIGVASNGDVYVFSGNNFGTKKAGALVIRKGATTFDKGYFWDLEAASGGYRFSKVWPLLDDIFLIEYYNKKYEAGKQPGMDASTQYAVVNMKEKKFNWVKGIPTYNNMPSGLSWPYVFEGKAYVGLTELDKFPQFYAIDPQTGTAKKGLVVKDANEIQAAAFIEKK